MAIHDSEVRGTDRSSPMPNSHDLQQDSRPAHGTNSVNYVTDATGAGQDAILSGNARFVKQGLVTVVAPNGSAGVITTTTTTAAHGLGFTPAVVAYINNVTGSGYGIPLPLWLSFGNNTGGTGGATEYLGVIRYMTCAVDGTNVYILTYSSGVAVAANYTITYYLYQQTAQR